jgi:hypothetical protein
MTDSHDLGFSCQVYKSGDVNFRHPDKLATTLRGAKASDAVRRLTLAAHGEAPQLMARLTGKSTHGNKRR